MSFTHLQVHSEFSLKDSLIRVDELAKRIKSEGMPAVALTDHNNLYGFVKFYQSCLKNGVKPICGVDLSVQYKGHFGRIVLIAMNNEGYRSLLQLTSLLYTNEVWERGVDLFALSHLCEHLIAICSPWQGISAQMILQGVHDDLHMFIQNLKDLFPERLYMGLIRIGMPRENFINHEHVKLCKQYQLAPVALGALCFFEDEDFEAHEVRVCISSGRQLSDDSREKTAFSGQKLVNEQKMRTLFADIPCAIENSQHIAIRSTVTLNMGSNYLPQINPPGKLSLNEYFVEEASQGLKKRLTSSLDAKAYWDRLKVECDIIIKMGFPSYFLIVSDFITWSKENEIPVGPGRGSGAGSLVAYALGITDLDPLKYDLLFERFLNPERVSMPDFDIDFCMVGRDRVIEYVQKKYGKNAVAQIITYGTMAAKAVVRDVGRVLGHPYGYIDKIAKLIPFEIGMTLSKAMEREAELANRYRMDEEFKEIWDLSLKLEGLTRNVGRHAGGVVIAPGDLTEFTALYAETAQDQIVTQYDKDDIEKIGLVKFDFLGLRTLTIIDWAVRTIRQDKGLPDFSIESIPLTDHKAFDLLKACNTTGVFQLESRGMKELLGRLLPDCFEDIVALVALYRPGPLQSGMVDDFVDRKHGRSAIEYPHDSLEDILKPTYGVILYQEQVMQIAQVLSGYTLGNADILRRAMGKKKVEEMNAQRKVFISGAKERGVDEALSGKIFDLVEKFAGYGFNKSHSAAYALITYQTAWLKANYPDALMAAVLSSDMDNTDKVVNFYEDTLRQKITVYPPCVNQSNAHFTVVDGGIRYGLGAIKGVGEQFARAVFSEVKNGGPYNDLLDFCIRLESMKVNRKMLESLIKAGAFDAIHPDRTMLFVSIDNVLAWRDKKIKDRVHGQGSLFAEVVHQDADWQVETSPWSLVMKLAYEKEVLGMYFSAHPMNHYRQEVKKMGAVTIRQLPAQTKGTLIGAILSEQRVVYTKSGRRFVVIMVEDETGKLEMIVGDEEYQRARGDLVAGELILCQVIQSVRANGAIRTATDRIFSLEEKRMMLNPTICIEWDLKDLLKVSGPLEALLDQQQEGACRIKLALIYKEERIDIPCGKKIAYNEVFLDQLRQLPGIDYRVSY